MEQAVDEARAIFVERFDFVQDHLRALVSPRPIVADGWGLRPELVAPLLSSPRRMVVMVPTEEFRRRQLSRLPRARALPLGVSDPELAQRKRIARDRILAEDAARSAERLDIRVIDVDGSRDAHAMADLVADHFHEFLPERPGDSPTT